MTSNFIDPKRFRSAAKLIYSEEESYCCFALPLYPQYIWIFTKMWKHRKDTFVWKHTFGEHMTEEYSRLSRITALLETALALESYYERMGKNELV